MTVWIVFSEWEEGGDGGHAVIESVHTTEAGALAAQQASREQWAGCWPTDNDQPSYWDVDVHVESFEVQTP